MFRTSSTTICKNIILEKYVIYMLPAFDNKNLFLYELSLLCLITLKKIYDKFFKYLFTHTHTHTQFRTYLIKFCTDFNFVNKTRYNHGCHLCDFRPKTSAF